VLFGFIPPHPFGIFLSVDLNQLDVEFARFDSERLGEGQLIFDIARIHDGNCTGLPRKLLLLSRAAEVLVVLIKVCI